MRPRPTKRLELSKGSLCDVLAAVERVIETFRSDEAMVMHCCLVLGNMTEVASFVRAGGWRLLSGRHRQRVDESYGAPTLQRRLVGGAPAIAPQGVLG